MKDNHLSRMKLLLSFLLLTTLTWQALAQSCPLVPPLISCPSDPPPSCTCNAGPCDQIARCLTQYRHTYPNDWRVLMDSINYLELIDNRDGVWQRLDVDGTGTTWQQAGGICGHEISVCERGANRNNWFFTQYISYLDAREIIVNVTHDFTGCIDDPRFGGCQPQVIFNRYERDGINAAAARDPNNYDQLLPVVNGTAGFGVNIGNTNFSFQPSSNSRGFYIGVQETGSCISIRRLTIYYRICPGRIEGVTVVPEIPLPPQDSDECTTKEACCLDNAVRSPGTSLEIKGYPNGTCAGNPECVCSRGYELVAATRNSAAFCRACLPDFYQARDSNDFPCQPCPANSETRNLSTAVCPCDCGFGRPPDQPDAPCTPITTPAPGEPCPPCPTCPTCPPVPPPGTPGHPSNVQVLDGVVVWDRPSNTGNREITQYELRFYASGGQSSATIRTVTNPDQQRYTPTQSILPSQGPVYVQVRARNSAGRTGSWSSQVVYASALGIVRDVRVIDGVVVWNEPSSTGVGNINGYDLRFYSSGGQSSAPIQRLNSATEDWYNPAESIIPSRRPAYVQVDSETAYLIDVRARNSAGRTGPWSAQVQYDVNECNTNNGGCAHTCTNTQGSFQCSCRSGYRLNGNGRGCTDFNECTEGTHNCDQICTNTQGSFRCSCRSGYTLTSDGRTCNGVTTTPITCATGCGGTLRGDSGCFNSPGWPESYPVNTDCEWTIELASTNRVIRFTYNESVYGIAGNTPCPRDYVEIIDGLADENAPSLGRSCFRETPPPVVTSTSQSTVRFHAGPSHNPSRRGFRLTYEAVDNSQG